MPRSGKELLPRQSESTEVDFKQSPLLDILRNILLSRWMTRLDQANRKRFDKARTETVSKDNSKDMFYFVVSYSMLAVYSRIMITDQREIPPDINEEE